VTTIDLGTPPPPPSGLLDGLPRRVTLTLPELQLVARSAGDAPLPFVLAEPSETGSLEGRLGASRTTTEDQAYAAALASLHDPRASLARRGLLVDDSVDEGLLGAVGLLATPEVAVDLDVAVAGPGGVQVKAWHRQAGEAVAALATCDGVVFELAWYATTAWPAELGRVAVLPEDLALRESAVPAGVDLPYELIDAAAEAVTSGRADLVPVLAARHDGEVLDAGGRTLSHAETVTILGALSSEARGRLRVLVADVTGETTDVVGVRSWVLLADGWRSLRPHLAAGSSRVTVSKVAPSGLAADLAPVLAQVATR
jgi:hypothetical protein